MYFPDSAAAFPAINSNSCPIVIRDGIPCGLKIRSGTIPSFVNGMSSCGTMRAITPFCP